MHKTNVPTGPVKPVSCASYKLYPAGSVQTNGTDNYNRYISRLSSGAGTPQVWKSLRVLLALRGTKETANINHYMHATTA